MRRNKMAAVWTKEQKQAIDLRDRSLLVSAAAGSGKTAVLVERIVSLITEGEQPLDVDRLLVVTFTNAAAAQLRERVQQALEKRLGEDPQNRHVRRQLTLIRQARITTIDSFCLSVLREQFHRINLDPSFRIADEGELRLLKEDVLSTLIEEKYAEADPTFLDCWEAYNPGRDDNRAAGLVLGLYEFAMGNPRPSDWLDACRGAYQASDWEELEQTAWMKGMCRRAAQTLAELAEQFGRIRQLYEAEDEMEAFAEILRDEEHMVQLAAERAKDGSYREIRAALLLFQAGRKPRRKKTDLWDEARANILWEQRKKAKDSLDKLTEWFSGEPELILERYQQSGRLAVQLIDLTGAFMERFSQAKRKRCLVDFHDLEHLTVEILSEKTEHGEKPTETAKEYKDRFAEIMIDEYQDSNYVQELILNSISREQDGKPNCFMVGDVKQSIYRFRLARPELFMEKYRSYTMDESRHQKVELHRNFRSRDTVLEGVNYVFRQIMHESLGNVEYDDAAALHPGAVFEKDPVGRAGGPIRLMLLDTEQAAVPEDEEDGTEQNTAQEAAGSLPQYNTREWEAAMIAGEIRRMTDPEHGTQVWDPELSAYRTAQYRDITILLRTISGWAEDFVTVLAANGVPAAAESGSGYFSAQEVQTVVNLLQIISNPIQDIPLAGVLHSPIGGFNSEELAKLKLAVNRGAEEAGEGGNGAVGNDAAEDTAAAEDDGSIGPEDGLYYVLTQYRLEHPDDPLGRKAAAFLNRLADYRERGGYLSIHELIAYIMEESGYYRYVCAMPGGERRKANLDMMLEKARKFESTSYQGVFQFVRYLEKLKKYSVDYPEAATRESLNAVRVMSIHKSKGLEFPIVFVSGLGKTFNRQDSRARVVLHPDYGIGTDVINIEERTIAPTLMKQVLAREITLDGLGEELRVLYVAMTRAKEQLILTAAVPSLMDKLYDMLHEVQMDRKEIPWLQLTQAASFFDWVIPTFAKHPCFDEIYRKLKILTGQRTYAAGADAPLAASLVTVGELQTEQAAKRLDSAWYRRQVEAAGRSAEDAPETAAWIRSRLEYDYHYDDMYRLAASMSVSEIKKRAGDEDGGAESISLFPGQTKEKAEQLPAFMKGETELPPDRRGTVYHYLYEHLDPCSDLDPLEQIERMKQRGVLTEQEIDAVNFSELERFYRTPLGKRTIRAREEGRFHAESPFSIGVRASEMNPDARIQRDGWVQIQGVIDAWFEEDGKIVLYDYKTDRIMGADWEQILTARYRVQLKYYRIALERMLGRQVDEIYLYSVSRGKAVKVDTDRG